MDALIHASWEPNSIVQTQSDVEFHLIRMPITTPAAVPGENDQWLYNPAVIDDIIEKGAFTDPASSYFSFMGGNEYNLVGLMEHAQPFDVAGFGSTAPHLITAGLMKALLDTAVKYRSEFLPYVASQITGPLFVAETPPPVYSNDFLRSTFPAPSEEPGAVDEIRISPPGLRMRLWRLVRELVEEHCEQIGATYVPVPTATLDDGFLAEAYRSDATHGNAAYGELWLRQIHAMLTAPNAVDPRV